MPEVHFPGNSPKTRDYASSPFPLPYLPPVHLDALALPVVHVHVDPAGLERGVQVLQECLCGQDISTFFFRGLYHELRIEHGLLSNLLASII